MQHEILTAHDLLDEKGNLIEAGWMRRPLLRYNRESIIYPNEEIREWDYYFIGDETFGLGFSTASVGPIHRLSVNFMDYKNDRQANDTAFCDANDSILVSPTVSSGSLHFKCDHAESQYIRNGNTTRIQVHFEGLDGKTLDADLTLTLPKGDNTVIVIPFHDKPGMFYYNHKINCIRAEGSFTYGELTHEFCQNTAYSVMDWGRGVWPHENTWYWGSANGMIAGKDFGFNIGYGFGDTSAATENMVVYDGIMHKLEHVKFHIPDGETSFKKPWKFTSSDQRLEMDFTPVLDRYSNPPKQAKYGSEQHQVFGYFDGRAVLDDGAVLQLNKIFGFAEKVVNHW